LLALICWSHRALRCVRAFLNFGFDPTPTPKIASPLRRNMPAQIYVKFDRYISMTRALAQIFSRNRWVRQLRKFCGKILKLQNRASKHNSQIMFLHKPSASG
jgi:hypothetical protein